MSALATRVQRQSMAPLIAEAAAAVAVLTIFISEVAGIPMMDRNTGKLYHRQRRRPVAAEVLAWGSRGKHDDNVVGAAARGSSLARQRVMDPKTSDSLGSMRSKSEVVVDDGSWTHSAFRAFHEMRAGRPQSDAHSEGDNEEEPLGEDITSTAGGPLRRVGRLTSRIPRYTYERILCEGRRVCWLVRRWADLSVGGGAGRPYNCLFSHGAQRGDY